MSPDLVDRVDRFVHFGLACTQMALADGKLDLSKEDKYRVGSVIGSGLGGLLFHEQQMMAAYERDTLRLSPAACRALHRMPFPAISPFNMACLGQIW
jgi:3-oxoacyl-(acyl-carrier-protein) synthase